MQSIIGRCGSRGDFPIHGARIRVDGELRPQTNRRRMLDARVTVHLVGQRVDIPGLVPSLAIVLATEIENFVLESLVAVPAVP